MEAMEVDSGLQPADVPYVVSDSGSSTEVEEDEDDGGRASPPRLPSTWAFSQRAAGSAPTRLATQGPLVRRRLRYQEADWSCSLLLLDLPHVLVPVPDRASGSTTPARRRRPPGTSQTSCSGLRLRVAVRPAPAAPPRSASPKTRTPLPKAPRTERGRSQDTLARRCRRLRPAVSVSSVEAEPLWWLTEALCSQTPDQLLREGLRTSWPRWVTSCTPAHHAGDLQVTLT